MVKDAFNRRLTLLLNTKKNTFNKHTAKLRFEGRLSRLSPFTRRKYKKVFNFR